MLYSGNTHFVSDDRTATPASRSSASPQAKSDPVFAAINRHRLAREHQNKAGLEHTKAENKAARSKDGENTPEFRAVDRKWNSALTACEKRMRELIETRPATIEGAAAQAAYARAIEFFEEPPRLDDYDPTTWSLDSLGRNLTRLVVRPYSAEFQGVLTLVAELEDARKKQHAQWLKNQKRYRRSQNAKRLEAKVRKLIKGPTAIEVATETKALQRVAAIVTALIPPNGEQMIRICEEGAKRRAKH